MAEAMGTVHLPTKAGCQDRVNLVFEVEDLGETVEQLRSGGFISQAARVIILTGG